MKKLAFLLSINLFSSVSPVIIVTYNQYDEAVNAEVDFNLRSNTVGGIKDIGQDDFYNKDVFGKKEAIKPIEDIRERLKFLNLDDDIGYEEYFNKAVEESSKDNVRFNLYNAGTYQPSYLAGDFSLTPDLFQKDPQLNSITDYYVNGQKIEWGQRILIFNQTFIFEIIRKDLAGFGGSISQPGTVYNITCPLGKRVVLDVNELEQLPTYRVTTKTKGCNITQANPTAF